MCCSLCVVCCLLFVSCLLVLWLVDCLLRRLSSLVVGRCVLFLGGRRLSRVVCCLLCLFVACCLLFAS